MDWSVAGPGQNRRKTGQVRIFGGDLGECRWDLIGLERHEPGAWACKEPPKKRLGLGTREP